MNHPILASGLIALLCLARGVSAEGIPEDSKAARYVMGFDDEVIEARRDDNFVLMETNELKQPPIEVIEDDGRGFVKVKALNGDEVWLSLSYIRLNEDEQPVCIQADIGKRTDRRLASAHGMGDQGCLIKD
ncbi:MAG TPA: hypothetical protein VIQ75_03290 [Gammaproteobacteria bacterium]